MLDWHPHDTSLRWFALMQPQVAVTLGDKVRIIKVDVDANPELSSMLKVRCWTDGEPRLCRVLRRACIRPAL